MASKKKDWRKQKNLFLKFWYYIWYDDSLLSYVANFIFAFILIKFLIFPTLGFFLGNDFPVVAIVSGSMEHKVADNVVCGNVIYDVSKTSLDFNSWWDLCGDYYERNFDLNKEEFSEFKYSDGLNIGDVMVLLGVEPSEVEVGDTLVFYPEMSCAGAPPGPVIHRVVEINEVDGEFFYTTKGDHNDAVWECMERKFSEDRIIGVAELRIPYLGYFKVILSRIYYSVFG